jgi:YHS domain-containing protein
MFKDPIYNMMVEEKNAQHISEVNGSTNQVKFTHNPWAQKLCR